ncbi:MAG: hypothetical protein A2231_08835 [Candidatus Firestonebacteria bacterium RIFOXYA2_FULL_40_8]|nr:MAG: hypothetical protein A2231_08835 [Candidatus Firestonebacteria bacterium RIFOXYA2_FULL_40_8]
MPFLPSMVKELGITNPKDISVWSGILFGVSFLFAAVFAPFWGSLGDRIGRKSIILRATFGLSVTALAMSAVENIHQLLFLRIVHGALGGIVPSFIALVSKTLPKEKTGEGLGVLQTAMIMGSVFGPLLGGILFDLSGVRTVMLFISLATFIAGLITVFFIHEEKQKPVKTNIIESVFKNIRFVIDSKHILTIAFIQFLIQFAILMAQPVLPQFIESFNSTNKSGTLIGSVFAVTGITTMIFAPFWGRLGDRKSHKRILSISLLGTGLAFIPQAFVFGIYMLFPVRILIGAFIAGVVPSTQTLLVRQTVENKRGGVLGICQSFSLLGTALGPIVGGSVAAAFGIRVSFLVTAGLLLITWYYSRTFIKETEKVSPVTTE